MSMHPRLLLMILLITYFVYRIGKGIWQNHNQHANEEDLRKFWNGSLEAENKKAYIHLRSHLGACDSCHARFQEIVEEGETRYSEGRKVIKRRF